MTADCHFDGTKHSSATSVPEKSTMKLSKLKKNPDNPRFIRDNAFKKLVQSIKDFPEMMTIRPIVVDEDFVVLGGNMRLEAIRVAGFNEIPDTWVKQVKGLSDLQKKEFIIKDNSSFGDWDWDILANEWEELPLSDWAVDIPSFDLGAQELEAPVKTNSDADGGSSEKSAIVCPSCGFEIQGGK